MDFVLLQILMTPLVASLIIFLLRRVLGRKAGWVAVGALFYNMILIIRVGLDVFEGKTFFEEYLLIAPKINLGLLADGLSLPTIGVINLLCLALSLYGLHYIEHRIEILYGDQEEETQTSYYTRFYYLFLLFPLGFMGVSLSTNLISLYFFMEVLTIALYFLMAYFGYQQKVKVAFICLAWGIGGALFFLLGSLMIYSQTGSFQIAAISDLAGNPMATAIIAVFMVGMLAKLAILPFHVWMPWVHAEHPTCIAGLLAVYANLALYIIIRTLVLPLGSDFSVFGTPLMVLALITMIYGSLLTMAQTDIKRLAACSTISQIAYSVLGLGALTTTSIEGGMFFFLSHIMGKTMFFSTAGIVVYVTGVRDMRQMGGLAKKMPLTAALWVMGAMMLSGFPPFSSFTAEWIMFTGIFERALLTSPAGIAVAILGILAIMLTVGYAFKAAKMIFFGPLSPEMEARSKDLKDPPLTMSIPLLVVATTSVVFGLYPSLVIDFLHQVIAPGV
jgi:formate hydrogenlyase subunit 3/multisubunit Na+/H+ antiporter MnhD subunit